MKILCVRQPWAWAIIHGGKDIENRCWETRYRGPLLIASSQGWHRSTYEYYLENFSRGKDKCPSREELVVGAILGKVDLVDCVDAHRSKWFEGDYGFVLRHPKPLSRPIPIKGRLGLFPPGPDLMRKLKRANWA